ncbi:hypothetical protein VP1G_11121 [Cytospora mali]|uniref:Uncharacterized protein n=1 Tax=Cytospora mali TaxID=578113 RepID=A0A194V5J4_CYTMA|nr:hypothetical protein VP1G_11121 [Valsa mali var. pyri (nom. inval.)]
MLKTAFWVLGLFLVIIWVVFIGAKIPATDTSGKQTSSVEDVGSIQSAKPTSTSREEEHSGTIMTYLVDAPPSPSPRKTASPRSWEPTTLTLWLAPVVASPSGRGIALAMYLSFLGAALLETYWLFVTCGRATAKMFRFWFILASWPLWLYMAFCITIFLDLVAFCLSAASRGVYCYLHP